MRRRTKPRTLPLGSVSSGTMRVEDVLPAVLNALSGLRLTREERRKVDLVRRLWDRVSDELDEAYQAREDDASCTWRELLESYLNEDLWDIANAHCPDYCYFGAHPGDGADYGVWVIEELFTDTTQGGYDGCCWRLSEGNSPTDESIAPEYLYALAVNDHGNATLYRRSGSRWTEVWAI